MKRYQEGEESNRR